MAVLSENSAWENTIYQLAVTDPISGGPVTTNTGKGSAGHGDGIANLQAQQLANRTAFLRDRVQTAVLGGTGLASYAAGDLMYASGATTLAKLPIGTANRVLASSGTAPVWSNTLSLAGLTLSSALPAASGGTGLASYAAGDLMYASGATTLARLPIAAASRVLTSTGAAPQWSDSLALGGAASFGGAVSTNGTGTFNGGLNVTNGLVGATFYGLNINSTSEDVSGVGVQLMSGGYARGRFRTYYDGIHWCLRLGSAEFLDTVQLRGNALMPVTDGVVPLGTSVNRFSTLWSVNGVIQTSLPEFKEVLEAPGDDELLAALRAVEIAPFHYHDDPGFDTGRKVRDKKSKEDRPVMQKHRHYGVMLPTLPEWARTTDEGVNPLNVAALALRGWQLHDARLSRIEAALKLR